ncbi:acetyl-CoA synthetase-like protein [Trametes versicolor FP-101664 SS1]|uniref:acetyl-CoA synthetase-like protein n=1 Tax=Trametes versicolor (strain FP-101664) TaxID=717944 RepID=UPI0004621C37|nr:acetyl-CoA synthetase-like protein [Trametes versicolor FP-101664 SS1]EIW54786.1 acetyl-CoA synthetase-like protein [Trametes versicolor FP-101664 SS1]
MRPFEGDTSSFKWGIITYQDFLDALVAATAYWTNTLTAEGLKQGDVVGMWLKGSHWSDLAHIYSVAAAGFVPEVFGLAFSAPFVQDLLDTHHARVLIYADTFEALLPRVEWHQTAVKLPKLYNLPMTGAQPSAPPDVSADDVAMIFHTSGTTGGRPKPIPQTHKWLVAEGEVTWKCVIQRHPEGQHIFNNIGSFASIGAATCVTFISWSGACLTQSAGREITADEFLAMVQQCGLNFLLQYAPWLAKLLAAARQRPEVLEALQNLQQIAYTGAALNPEDERWALEQGIRLTPMYANTECGPLMVASLDSGESYLRLASGVRCELRPLGLGEKDDSSAPSRQLYEFFVSAESKTCPHPTIRNRPDGHVTGDLFEEVKPGCYVFRGRSDDWIRTGGNPAFCDTKAIEENVLKTCEDIVHNCVVVGHQRVCPVLVVETEGAVDVSTPDAEAQVKRTIVERTAPFNERLFAHERITTPECILFVPVGSLPRTTEKGNVRRKATEVQFKTEIENIYLSLV